MYLNFCSVSARHSQSFNIDMYILRLAQCDLPFPIKYPETYALYISKCFSCNAFKLMEILNYSRP